MPVNDELGMRMKHNYEEITKYRLTRRTPVAIRLDGRAFHTFTKGFQKPFDPVLHEAMVGTMFYLLENIQGAKFGYAQSDEITIILTDYDNLETQAWFDYELQKLCSISASMATMKFNQLFEKEANSYLDNLAAYQDFDIEEERKYVVAYERAITSGAMFDARCFNIPKEEVGNLIVWRWMDAKRNSVQMVGQAFFSHKELQGKNQKEICQMLADIHQPWFQYPDEYRFGVACFKSHDGNWIRRPAYHIHESIYRLVSMCVSYQEEE